jgi:hypothetical protein
MILCIEKQLLLQVGPQETSVVLSALLSSAKLPGRVQLIKPFTHYLPV